MSPTVGVPHSCMQVRSSSVSSASTFSTPSCPAAASPHTSGRPTSTAVAPSASAVKASRPRRTPPSTNTWTNGVVTAKGTGAAMQCDSTRDCIRFD
jgi:hypothetical protein